MPLKRLRDAANGDYTCSLALTLAHVFLFGIGAFSQTPMPSASPTITTATCGKPTCTWNAFGPITYTRQTGQPQTISSSFSVLNPSTQFTLHIDNNGVSSAVITLNGTQIFGPSDFDPNVTSLNSAVTLTFNNTLLVQLRGKPGTFLAVSVIGVDNTPPAISDNDTPAANSFGWNNSNVSVSFVCSDAISGIASCPSPVLLATEGLNQLAAGTTFDLAGNSATATVRISIDKTPPTILASQNPPANSAGWNNTPVTVAFLCNDNLSGIQNCTPPVTVSSQGQNQTIMGTATDFAGNSATASTAVSIDLTPPLLSISSPANGATVTSANLQLTGTVSDNLSGVASVSCNGVAAAIAPGAFSCNVTLPAGANTIQVQAADRAGNVATAPVTVTFNAMPPPPPPTSLLITPSMVNMLVGNSRSVSLIGDIGQPVTGATWSISDPTIVSITAADPPQLTALAQGTATLTAAFSGLTANMTINVLPALPTGTPLWAFSALPGNVLNQMVPANPMNPGDPDIYVSEGANTLRGFTVDGRQLWAIQVNLPLPSPSPQLASSNAVAARSAVTAPARPPALSAPLPQDTRSPLFPPAPPHFPLNNGVPDPIERNRQQLAQTKLVDTNSSPAVKSNLQTVPLDASSPGGLSGVTFVLQTVPDNSGGVIQVVQTCIDAGCSIFVPGFVRIDNTTQQPSWTQQLLDGPYTGPIPAIAVAADNTIYVSGAFQIGPADTAGTIPTHSLIASLNGNTGAINFKLPILPSHSTFIRMDNQGNILEDDDIDEATGIGPLAVMPDGSLQTETSSAHQSETLLQNSFTCAPSFQCATQISNHLSLQFLRVLPGGNSTSQTIRSYDLDDSNCAPNCIDPGSFNSYSPGDVIPDGLGGTLAAWTQNQSGGPVLNLDHLVRHIDNAGNIQDYDLPALVPDFTKPSSSMVLGENNIAYGAGFRSLIGFDVTNGSPVLNFQSAVNQRTGLLEATGEGGLLASLFDAPDGFDQNLNSVLSFDTSGTLTSIPLTTPPSTVVPFDPNNLLAIVTNRLGQMLIGSLTATLGPNALWYFTNGNLNLQRAPIRPTIQSINPPRGLIGDTVQVTINGSFGTNPSITFDQSINAVVNTSEQNQITATLTIDGKANTGKHTFTVTDQRGPSDPRNFFVQIPASLQVKNVVVLPDGPVPPSGCPGSLPYGIQVDITYQVLDQDDKPQPILSAIMTPHEQGTLFKGTPFDNDIGPVQGFPTSGKTTAPDGTFHDVPFGLCSAFPISTPGRTGTQNITMILPNQQSYLVRSQTATVSAPGVQSFEHGTLTNQIQKPGSGSDIQAKR